MTIRHLLFTHLQASSKRLSRRGLNEFIVREINNQKALKALSIGSGGPIELAVKAACQHDGIDLSTGDVDPDRSPDIVMDICKDEIKHDHYDIIILGEVLEHLIEPKQAIKNIFHGLKPGGKIILTVPYTFPIHDEPFDYYRYTKYGLRYMFSEYCKVNIEERNGWAECICVLMARSINAPSRSLKKLSMILVPFAVVLAYPARIVDRIFPCPFITTGYLLTANKPGV